MRQMRNIVEGSAEDTTLLQDTIKQMSNTMSQQQQHLQNVIAEIHGIVYPGREGPSLIRHNVETDNELMTCDQLQQHTNEIMNVVKQQEKSIEREMRGLKQALSLSNVGKEHSSDTQGMVVYVGPEIEEMLTGTEQNLEWKMKVNALWTVTILYGALAITVPVIYNFFKS